MQKILISIIHYKNPEVTVACLRSLEKIVLTNWELSIFVVNNDIHTPFSYKWKGTGKLTIENQKENLGFSGGHNQGLKQAIKDNTDYVLVLNNDTTVSPTFLQELLNGADQHEKGGVFGPKIYFAKGHEFHASRYSASERGKVIWYAGGIIDWKNMLLSHFGVDAVDTGQYDETRETDFVSGCCMLLRTSVLKDVGLFDERYFLYLEDSDLNMRITRAGYKVYVLPRSVIWHENAGSTGGSGSDLQDYFITRNRLLFGSTYAPSRTKFALLRESLRLLSRGRKWQKIGVSDFYLKRFGKGSYKV